MTAIYCATTSKGREVSGPRAAVWEYILDELRPLASGPWGELLRDARDCQYLDRDELSMVELGELRVSLGTLWDSFRAKIGSRSVSDPDFEYLAAEVGHFLALVERRLSSGLVQVDQVL